MNAIMLEDLFTNYLSHSDIQELLVDRVAEGEYYCDVFDDIYGDFLEHYGMPRRSGRYPWGSGKDPYQRNKDFLSYVDSLKAKGLSEAEIAKYCEMSTTELRAMKSMAVNQVKAENIAQARRLKDHGYSNTKIGEIMGAPESTVRGWLKPGAEINANRIDKTAEHLKELVAEKQFIDVTKYAGLESGISDDTLKTAVASLELQGYTVHYIKVEQLGTGKYTTVKVLAPPNTDWKTVNSNKEKIQSIKEYSPDGGETFVPLEPPVSFSSKRLAIRYGDEQGPHGTGEDNDGVIELRRGVPDVSLGKSNYAQVRIAVDGTHYLKGMARYSDDLPDGVDILFNTNKASGTPMMDVLKEMKSDPDNPFGALIKANGQTHYIGKDGKDHISVVNKIKEEGEWDAYSKNLASQFLSKQPLDLIRRQLKLSYADKQSEYDEINSLTLPALRKKMLIEFGDECDSAAVSLKAAALPGQSTKVLLPVSSIKDGQCYVPTLPNGQEVVLVRYPHAGTFEIPRLKNNTKDVKAANIVGKNSVDAIGINHKTAQQLSGADFDGDTVIVIPVNDRVKVKTSAAIPELIKFDPKAAYPKYDGMQVIKSQTKQNEMGRVSNLITDMTLRGADEKEIIRAVKHSMVVIDSEKHKLNYKQSEIDNGIAELKKKYQGKATGGASTLISKAKSEVRDIPERKEFNPNIDINKETGEKTYRNTGRSYEDKKTGKTKIATESSTRMAETKDAFTLSSGTPQETLYANYANQLKALANTARKEAMAINNTPRNSSAAKVYSVEVASLNAKLKEAKANAPRERRAQLLANADVDRQKQANPSMDKDDIKKAKTRALAKARDSVGAHKKEHLVEITENEWKAIMSGAISGSTLSEIFSNTNPDKLKNLAMPKQVNSVSSAKVSKIKAMQASGYTIGDIANATGLSASTVSKYLN